MPSIELIDFDFKCLFFESLQITAVSKGGITFDNLCNMSFDRYEKAYILTQEYNRKTTERIDAGNE